MLAPSMAHHAATGVIPAIIGAECLADIEEPIAVLTLNDTGMIRECSQAVCKLLGYRPSKLIWQHISLLLPQLAETTVMKAGQVNPRLHFLSRIGYQFDVIGQDGAQIAGELFFSIVETLGRQQLRIIIRPT